jgi:hypothetical protein
MRKSSLLAAVFLLILCAVTTQAANTIIDLTATGNSSSQIAALGGSFTVEQVGPQPTGTGFIDSFLRVQAKGSEQGYNTDNGTPLDDKGGNFTRSLLLSEIPIVDVGGTLYRQFLLDINQNVDTLLSLNQIQLFQSNSDPTAFTLTGATSTNPPQMDAFTLAATEVFRMNNSSNSTNPFEIELNAKLNSGSGSGDMFLFVPDADFNRSLSNVILYSQFGKPNGADESNGGFEEWAVVKGAPVPEPGSLILLGTGLLIVGLVRRKSVPK